MHLKSVIRSLGLLLLLMVLSMSFALAWGIYEAYETPGPENWQAVYALLVAMGIGCAMALGFLVLARGATGKIGIREALLLTTISWLWGAFVGALPFYSWALISADGIGHHPFLNFVNCYFEAMSGLTTTGASILSDIPALPKAILLWRANIQWLGGLGIVVLFVAILPWLASGNQKLYRAESTGISSDTGTANLEAMARGLWGVYMGITALQVILMKLCDSELSWFTAITFGFSTAATAGFSIFNESAGTLNVLNQWVVAIFMMIAGVNYALLYGLVRGNVRRFAEDWEFKSYITIVVIATVLIFFNILLSSYPDMLGNEASPSALVRLKDAFFQVVSIQTTTGFSNANSDAWPAFSQIILVLLMFIGGCGGSTGGGIKVIRIVSAFRLMLSDIEKVYRPHIVRPVKVGAKIMDAQARQNVLVYILIVLFLSGLATLILALLENQRGLDLTTLFTAVVACINNIGPGFSLVGVTQNYLHFADSSKVMLAMLMVIGRLEVFTVLALFMPRYWRRR